MPINLERGLTARAAELAFFVVGLAGASVAIFLGELAFGEQFVNRQLPALLGLSEPGSARWVLFIFTGTLSTVLGFLAWRKVEKLDSTRIELHELLAMAVPATLIAFVAAFAACATLAWLLIVDRTARGAEGACVLVGLILGAAWAIPGSALLSRQKLKRFVKAMRTE